MTDDWPLPRRAGSVEHVNAPETEAELAALRRCVQRGSPFGEDAWCDRLVRRLGLESWPEVSGVKSLSGNLAGRFRIRTGDYRVQFWVEGRTVVVGKIGHRDGFHDD